MVLAKWRIAGVKIVILDHPTRGIDVGAKEDVYELIRDMTAEGLGVILLGDTLEEVIGLSSRILVMRDGEITGTFEDRPAPSRRRSISCGIWCEPVNAGLKEHLKRQLPSIVLVALVLFVGFYDGTFFSRGNLLTVGADTMTLFLMASGVTLVIMMGGIDLSIQAVASMTSCIVAAYLARLGFLAVPLAVLGGMMAGFAGGVVSTKLRIPSFIATLAVSGVVTTAAYWFSDTRSVNIPAELRSSYLFWAVGETFGVPNEIWCGLVFLAILSAILSLTPFGRMVRAIGSQERAVLASGVAVDRYKIAAFTISGMMAGIAGVVMAARLGSGSPTLANEFLLPAIACIIVGGTAITGGVGSIWRTFIGALIVQVVRIGMTFMGVSVFAQQIVFGLILVAAVAVTMDRGKILVIK